MELLLRVYFSIYFINLSTGIWKQIFLLYNVNLFSVFHTFVISYL